MSYYFTDFEKVERVKRFKNGDSLRKLAQKFGCSYSTIRRHLIIESKIENYTKVAKEHTFERTRKMGLKYGEKNLEKWKKEHPEDHAKNGRKSLAKWREEHPEEVIKACQKAGKNRIKNLIKWNTKNHNYISRPEALFYITRLTKNFYSKDIVPQFFIKELNHRVDFAIPSQKLLFEVDGDYTHSRPGRKERDTQVDKWAKENGWTMFRFNDKKMRKLGIIK